jgi:hypothetical protein
MFEVRRLHPGQGLTSGMEPAEAVITSFLNDFVSLSRCNSRPRSSAFDLDRVSVVDCRRLRSREPWLSLNSLDINARYQQ